jgi:hypothetical protein
VDGFLEVILVLKKWQDAPFRTRSLEMIKLELHRNYVEFTVLLNWLTLPMAVTAISSKAFSRISGQNSSTVIV